MRSAFAVVLLLTAVSAAAADLSDVQTFLGQTAYDEALISPDGARLAFITRRNDFERDREETALWLIDLSRPAEPVQLTETGNYSGLRWSPDGRAVTFLGASAEAGAQVFLLSPTAGATPRRLTDPARFTAGVDLYEWLPDGSGLILAAAEPPDEASMAAQRRLRDFYGDVRRLSSSSPAPGSALYRLTLPDGRVERFASASFDVPESLNVSPDGRRLAIIGSGLRQTVDTGEVALLPLTSASAGEAPRRTRNLITEGSLAWVGSDLFVAGSGEEKDRRYTMTEARMYRVDAGDLHLVRVAPGLPGYLTQQIPLPDGSLLTLSTVSTGMHISRVEPASGKVVTLRDHRGWIANLSASRSGDRIAFVAGDNHHFSEIYLATGLEGMAMARPVTRFNADLSRGPLPEIETVSWRSDDGTNVEGVIFWPPGRKGEKGLPLIVDLHGGPFGVARTEAVDLHGSYMSYPALLAARGFLVLNPNYRGSAGRGDRFAQGIEGHRCSRPSQDVIRGVESLIACGWADRQRVGLIGYSGGGGLSKCLLGRTDLFRAICTGAGIWDDVSLFGTARGGMWAEAFYESKPLWSDFQLWWTESPVSGLGRAKTPTLIVAGERDSSAAPEQAAELYHGLVWRGVPAELLLFPGEGHVFSGPSHKRTKIRAEVSWLEHYVLGKPRAELSAEKP